jgi:hypothetical protein
MHAWKTFYLRKGKGKVFPVLNQAPRHKDALGEWRKTVNM